MILHSGARLGPYEIVDPIAAGGMGEIYRARASRLDRVVALKILPQEFAGDPSRLSRFEKEARLASSLNQESGEFTCSGRDPRHRLGFESEATKVESQGWPNRLSGTRRVRA